MRSVSRRSRPPPRRPNDYSLIELLESRIALSAATLNVLASFAPAPDGNTPVSLAEDAGGNLFGATVGGGAGGYGAIFELPHGSTSITTLASFNNVNGSTPYDLTSIGLDSSGNIFGTASAGGTYGDGTLFELPKGSGVITLLTSFNGANGQTPQGGVVLDSSGNLFGTASYGGADNDGTVFEVAHGSSVITTLASFNGVDGQWPWAGVTLDASGNLFGTATDGGLHASAGTVFEVAKGTGAITALASFNDIDGRDPQGGAAVDSSGNVFGTTQQSGAYGDGTAYEIAKGTGEITLLASFNGRNGQAPDDRVFLDSSGDVLGTTTYGGRRSDGTLFQIAPGTSAITTLFSFNGDNGSQLQGGLILDPSGNLLGTTYTGGADNDGTIFAFNPSSGSGLVHASQQLRFAPTSPATVVGNLAIFNTQFATGNHTNSAFDIYDASSNTWSTARLHGPSYATSGKAVTLDDQAIFTSDGNYYPGVTIYHGASGTWTAANLSVGRGGLGVTTLADKAFFAGGLAIFETQDVVDIYDAITGLWSTAQLSQARMDITTASVGDVALFAGGAQVYATTFPADATNVLDIYNNTTSQWSTASLSVARYGMTAVVVGDKAIFAGGYSSPNGNDLGIPSNAVDIYDASTGQMSSTTLAAPCDDIAVATVGDEAFFSLCGDANGQAPEAPGDLVEIYNATTNTWTTTHLSSPRNNIAVTSLGNNVIFAGGEGRNRHGPFPSNVVDIYNTVTGRWSTTTLSAAGAPGAAVTAGPTAIFTGSPGFFVASDVVDTFTDPNLTSPLLTGSIGGIAAGRVPLTLANTGTAPLAGGSLVNVYASTGKTLDRTAVLLGSVRMRSPLDVGSTVTASTPITIPQSLPAGPYYLIAAAGPRGNLTQFAVTRRTVNLPPVAIAASPADTRTLLPSIQHRSASLFSTTPIAADGFLNPATNLPD